MGATILLFCSNPFNSSLCYAVQKPKSSRWSLRPQETQFLISSQPSFPPTLSLTYSAPGPGFFTALGTQQTYSGLRAFALAVLRQECLLFRFSPTLRDSFGYIFPVLALFSHHLFWFMYLPSHLAHEQYVRNNSRLKLCTSSL